MRLLPVIWLLAFALMAPTRALAWGREGHAVIAKIAYAYLSPRAAATVDALLAADRDPLTAPDLAARASWADAFARAHPETAPWHFIGIQIDDPDLDAACTATTPSGDCLVRRLQAYEGELAAPSTPRAERLVAFKFVLHLVGDLHQPLHVADNQDFNGGCIPVAYGASGAIDLLRYWDTVAVEALEPDASKLASRLITEITPADRVSWEDGDAEDWALESFNVARTAVYTIGSDGACASDTAPVFLPQDYSHTAQAATALQLKRAGVRLALVLNRIFDAPAFPLTKPGSPERET
jgi:hypothetical protein